MSIFYQNRQERLRLYTSDNNTFATHLHSQVELLLVLDGELTLQVNHTTQILRAGDGALIFPNQLHSLETEGHSRILLCIFDGDFCHSYRKYFQNTLPAQSHFSRKVLSTHNDTAVEGLLALTKDFKRGEPIPDTILALAEGYLTLLLAELFSYMTAHMLLKPKTAAEDLELEQRLLIYLDSHYTEPLSLELLSKEFGVSRFVLSRLFTEHLHTTFPNYVNQKRLALAKDLLTSTDLSVTRIALDAGFGSTRTFFRAFSEAFHTTPGDYRRQHLGH